MCSHMAKNRYKRRSDGTFETKLQTGFDNDGKRVRLSISADSSIALENKVMEYKAKLKQLVEAYPTCNGKDYKEMLLSNTIIKCSSLSLAEYASDWFITHKSMKEINTKAMYKNIIDKHIVPGIGHIPVNHLRHSDVQHLLTITSDRPRTCQQILLVLKQIFRDLKRDMLITSDVYDTLIDKYDTVKYRASKKRILTDLEKKAILAADFSRMEKGFVMILYFFGVRREEALGLMKSDFDFTNRMLNINRAIVFDQNTPVIKSTKSFAGTRSINIPNDIYDYIREYVRSCPTMYLFTKQDGTIITKSCYDKMWKRIVDKMNVAVMSDTEKKYHQYPIKNLTAHLFRHNYCTMLYYSGISVLKAVELMGHADKKMIMDIYSHLDEEREDAATKIDNSIKLEKVAL